MDLNTIIAIVVAVAVIYLFVRFIVSPLIKAVLGVILFLVAIYILQRYFNFNLNNVLGPFASYFGWIAGPVNYCTNLAASFLHPLVQNFTKSLKQ